MLTAAAPGPAGLVLPWAPLPFPWLSEQQSRRGGEVRKVGLSRSSGGPTLANKQLREHEQEGIEQGFVLKEMGALHSFKGRTHV